MDGIHGGSPEASGEAATESGDGGSPATRPPDTGRQSDHENADPREAYKWNNTPAEHLDVAQQRLMMAGERMLLYRDGLLGRGDTEGLDVLQQEVDTRTNEVVSWTHVVQGEHDPHGDSARSAHPDGQQWPSTQLDPPARPLPPMPLLPPNVTPGSDGLRSPLTPPNERGPERNPDQRSDQGDLGSITDRITSIPSEESASFKELDTILGENFEQKLLGPPDGPVRIIRTTRDLGDGYFDTTELHLPDNNNKAPTLFAGRLSAFTDAGILEGVTAQEINPDTLANGSIAIGRIPEIGERLANTTGYPVTWLSAIPAAPMLHASVKQQVFRPRDSDRPAAAQEESPATAEPSRSNTHRTSQVEAHHLLNSTRGMAEELRPFFVNAAYEIMTGRGDPMAVETTVRNTLRTIGFVSEPHVNNYLDQLARAGFIQKTDDGWVATRNIDPDNVDHETLSEIERICALRDRYGARG